MDSAGLRAAQQPLKDAYRTDPQQAVITLRARGQLGEEDVSCSVATGQALAVAGLLAQGETEIEEAECVAVSYPGFWDDLELVCSA